MRRKKQKSTRKDEILIGKFAKELTKDQFASAMKANPIVILPIGCMEEHGGHLPIGSDTFEIEYVIDRLAKKLKVLVLPIINYGNCGSTYNFPGTISISFEALRILVREILSEAIRHGAKKIMVISGHAGSVHMSALRMAAQDIVKKNPDIKLMVLSDYELVPGYKGGNIPTWDGHAGKAETSRLLNIRPDISNKGTVASRTKRKEFMVVPNPESMFPSGISGDPRHATPELGEKIDDFILSRLVKLMKENLEAEDG